MFFRLSDIISLSSILKGEWEEETNSVIRYYSKKGYSNFFIDVGANIGLSTCQNNNYFKFYYCVEPNPLCFNVLKVNLNLNLESKAYKVFNVGLYDRTVKSKLFIPKRNWGGAFVKNNNPYNISTLLKKENLTNVNEKEFIVENIKLLNGYTYFHDIFKEIKKKKFTKGFIKIDVEGFEIKVIQYIAKNLPNNISIILFFENWDLKFDFKLIRKIFKNHHIKLKYINKNNGFNSNYSLIDFMENDKKIGHFIIEIINY